MRRDSTFCAKSVRYNIFTNDAPYPYPIHDGYTIITSVRKLPQNGK